MAASKKKAANGSSKAARPKAPKKRRVKKRDWKPKSKSDTEMQLGLTFRRLRKAKGFSMRGIARRMGIAVNSVRWHEAGATMLRADDLLKATEILDCTANDVMMLADHEDDVPVNRDA